MNESRARKVFRACFACLLLGFLNSCNLSTTDEANKPQRATANQKIPKPIPVSADKKLVPEVKVPQKDTVFSMKISEKAGKHQLNIKTDKLNLKSYDSRLIWWLKSGKDSWLINITPSSSGIESIKTIADDNKRKTVQFISKPFKLGLDSYQYLSEITVLRNFQGVFFRLNLKNIGSAKGMGYVQASISMKKTNCFTYKGEQKTHMPYHNVKHIKNWVFLPSGAQRGLGLIANYALPEMALKSNFGRKPKAGGKRITETSRSSWLLSRFGQMINPGKTAEMSFAIVAADSPKKTAKLCQQIKKENLFPELKLQKGNESIQTPKTKKLVKQEVKPILNPKFYSAGKMPAAEIDKWVKSEIRPELFDIWQGKKERLYLDGSWKLLKLAGTKEAPNCDYGLKHGFEKSNFDDSKWFNQPVPFFWNNHFKDRDGLLLKPKSGPLFTCVIFGGVGWYRKNFTIPESFKGKRVLICVPGIEQEATIYVNGNEVGSNKTLTVDSIRNIFRTQHNYFEFDITDALNFGKENTLAVRCFDNGDFYVYCNRVTPTQKKAYSGIGGIWQEVYLESRPSVYLKKAMLTYSIKDSKATVKAYIINTNDSAVKEKLHLDFSPWKSKRYSKAKGEPFSVELGDQELKPGENTLVFNFDAQKAKLWSPEKPNLYEMALTNGKKQIIGRERVGFREFRAGKNYFYLNGEKITMRGHQCLWSMGGGAPGVAALHLQMGLMNRKNVIGKWYDKYKGMNHNVVRNHSTFYPHSFYDIADEAGIMVYSENYFKREEPFFDKNGVITNIYREKIKGVAEEAMRHPSVIAYSLGNELYDSWVMNEKIDTLQHYLDQIYDEFKKHCKTIPLTSCGRAPTEKSMDKTGANPYALVKKHAKSDFGAVHNYTINWYGSEFAEDDDFHGGLKNYKEAYDMDDKQKVMWNTESIISAIPRPATGYSKVLDKQFRPHVKNGMFDRKWFADNWSFIGVQKYGTMAINHTVPKFGFMNATLRDRAMKSQAAFLKHVLELHRRKRQYVAGVVGNAAMIFKGGVKNPEMDIIGEDYVSEAARKANQPVLACLDAKWNRNIFSGANSPSPLYVMNDHEHEINDIVVQVSLRALDAKKADTKLKDLKIDKLAAAEMKTIDYKFDVPQNIETGHYSVVLTTKYQYQGEKRQSINDYKTFIMNRQDIKLDVSTQNKIALIQGIEIGTKKTATMLEKLKVPFTLLKDAKNLKNFKKAILPFGSSLYPKGIAEWVKKGGKLLSLAQVKLPDGFPQKVRVNKRYGFLTELIYKIHPVLKGLEQSDFRYWNGKREKLTNKWVADHILLPLCEGVIASQMTVGNRIGMTIAEYRLGEGVCLLSQLDATKRFETDSVATKYLLNTLNYCLGDWNAPDAPTLDAQKASGPAFTVNPKDAFYLDIKKACTMGFTDEKAGDQKGGWTDQGPKNDLRNIAIGKHTFNGVPFDIINPADNNGKSCIVLRGKTISKTGFLPLKKRINLNIKASKLYFLVSSAWTPRDSKIGCIKISEEADGSEMQAFIKIDLVSGENVADWWNAPANQPSEAEMGWIGFAGNEMDGHEVGSFIIEWINPNPKKIINYIDFESEGKATPAILAITGIK